jgi:hypothetical protein
VAVDINRVVASAIEAAFEGEDHHEPQQSRHRGVKALAAGAALVATARVVSTHGPKLSKLGALTALGKATQLPDMIRDVPDRVRDRLADSGWTRGDSDVEPEDLADDEALEVDEDLDEDEDYDDEDEYGEPEAEADLDEEAPLDEDEEADDAEGEGDEGPDDEGGGWPDDKDDDGGGGDAAEVEEDDEEAGVAASGEGSAVEQAAQGLGVDTNGHRASARGPAPDVISMLSSHRAPPLLARAERERVIDPVTRPPEPPTTESASESKPSRGGRSSGSKSRSGGSKSRSSSSKSRSTKPKSGSTKSRSTKSGSTKSGSTKSGPRKAKAGSR